MSKVINQHYVPQFYLEWFTNKNGQIWTFDKGNPKTFVTQPKNVAAERYFYDVPATLNPEDTKKFQVAERALSDVEALSSGIIKELITNLHSQAQSKKKRDGKVIFRKARAILSHFLSIQSLRTPDAKDFQKELSEKANKLFLDAIIKNYGLGNPEDFRIELSEEQHTIEHVSTMLSGGIELMPILFRHTWVFGLNTTSIPLITSDAPVLRVPHVHDELIPATGFASPGIEILFPLSPEILLMIFERTYHKHLNKLDGKTTFLTEAQVLAANEQQIRQSRRQIYSCNDDMSLAKMLCKKEPQLSTLSKERINVS